MNSLPIRKKPQTNLLVAWMLFLALTVACPLYFQGAPLMLAAIVGAVVSVLVTWFFAYWVGGAYIKYLARFRVGDLVVVMNGPRTGATGKVTALGKKGSRSVMVVLQENSASVEFETSQIQKL